MTQPNPSQNPGAPREINFQQVAQQFMAGLQRHFDMLAFNLASREAVTEDAYNRRVQASRAMPVPQLHLNFEQMQAHARDLLVRQVINDLLNLAMACLNNCHLFLAAAKAQKEHGPSSPEVQKLTQAAQQAFVPMPFHDKFDRLESDYGIMCELEDTITSLGFCMQALVQQGGVVREPQLDEQKRLVIEMKQSGATSMHPAWANPGELQSISKAFSEGDRITFSDEELQALLITVSVFAHQLFTSVADFARGAQQS